MFFSRRTQGRRTRVQPTAPWAPTSLSGCVLWLRSDRGITLVSGAVSQWNDQSGKGNNATQGTAAARPTYNATDSHYGNKPTLSFASASSQQMALAALFPNQPFTAYVVGESSSGAAQQEFFGDNTNNVNMGIALTFSLDWLIGAGTNLTSTNLVQGAAQAFAGVFNGASSVLYINSSSVAAASGTAGVGNPAGSEFIGSNSANFLNGKIAEVVVYNQVHAKTQVAEVFSYLGKRYAISGVA